MKKDLISSWYGIILDKEYANGDTYKVICGYVCLTRHGVVKRILLFDRLGKCYHQSYYRYKGKINRELEEITLTVSAFKSAYYRKSLYYIEHDEYENEFYLYNLFT